jgi:hypothetical protein
LDAVYGNDQTLVVIDRREDSANPVQAPTADPDLLADVKKRMRRKGNLFSDNRLQGFYLLVGNGTAHAPHTHKTKHAICLQNLDARILLAVEANKDVGTEQRKLNPTFPIAPLMYLDG